MCGIAGIIDLSDSPISKDILEDMSASLIHRGPDGHGIYTNKNLGFAHRRLSIIDVTEAGNQPMTDEAGDLVISYNGEIYNFLEIKEELKAKGYAFRSDTDTEVVLYSWKEWGKQCIHKFNGMFAFSIYDRRNGRVF